MWLTSLDFDIMIKGMDGIEKRGKIRRNDRDFPTVEWVNGSSGWQKTEHIMTEVIQSSFHG